MEKPKKYEDRLMDVLAFDDDDLDANRLGHLSTRQQAKFAGEQWRIGAFMIALVLSFIGWIAAGSYFGGLIAASLSLMLLVAPAVAALLLIYAMRLYRVRRDAQTDDVLAAEGRINLAMRAVSINNVQCTLEVGDVKFPLKQDAFLAFKNGDPYAIYYTRRSKKLLSAEWLRGEDNLLSPAEIDAAREDDQDDETVPETTTRQRRLSR